MRIYARLLTGIVALALAVGSAAPAAAQSASTPATSVEQAPWTEHFGAQIRALLETGDPERQEDALRYVLRFAGQPGADIDFAPAVPAIFEIYEDAEHEGLRIMALSALTAVGDEPVMARLADRVHYERSDRVRRHTLRMLKVRLKRRSGGTEM